MFKPVLTLAAVGLFGIVLWKVAAALLLPLVFLVFKIALIVGLVMLAFWFFNKRSRGKEDTPPPAA
jgi:Flp pilus assembly protein TadB